MSYWMGFGAWKQRHRELIREAERGRLAREVQESGPGAGARERDQGDMRVGLAARGLPEGGWLPVPRW